MSIHLMVANVVTSKVDGQAGRQPISSHSKINRIFTPIIFGLHGFYQQAALFTTNQEFQQYLQKIIPSQTQSQWNQNTLFKVPLAQQEQVSRGKATYWAENNFDLWTTNTNTENHSAPISSIQNGFLLQSSIHQSFNDYSISVNPDDNYKITCFIPDDFGVDGRILDPVCPNPADPNRVSDNLLRWHFRQSILRNMRGAGEPSWEHDFPPGSDMLREILEGPFPIERFEMELSARLRVGNETRT
ncbi:hypothetical protein DTO166G4_4518 [Paecilomyces variotii]|nr:hypothetical protein DTO166G4_4518 [Paecilomyces variotii]